MSNSDDNASLDNIIGKLNFNGAGLIPAVAQQFDTGEVLMMAWMNADAIRETIKTGRICYFSRSRHKLWKKGESSGQIQSLKKFRIDCDRDTILLLVDQVGVACHTGRRNCFFEEVNSDGEVSIIADVEVDPDELYK